MSNNVKMFSKNIYPDMQENVNLDAAFNVSGSLCGVYLGMLPARLDRSSAGWVLTNYYQFEGTAIRVCMKTFSSYYGGTYL